MKKLLLPLLLILSISFLAAYESDPSAVVGYVKYDLVAGNNMVALPMTCPWSMASELGATFGGTVDQIFYWDATTQAFVGAFDVGFMWDNDFPIATNAVLMINSSAAGSFYSAGALPAPATYSLVAGNNTLMIPLNKSTLAMASDLGAELAAGSVDQIFKWDAASQAFAGASDLGFMWDNDFAIGIAMPLMAYAYTPISWPSRAQRSTTTIAPSKTRN